MLFLATKSTSYPFQGASICRAISRIRRFAALRQQAFPLFFPAINATRPHGPCSEESLSSETGAKIKVRNLFDERVPDLKRAEISVLDLMVFTRITRRDACDLSPDGETERRDHPSWTYEHGSHDI